MSKSLVRLFLVPALFLLIAAGPARSQEETNPGLIAVSNEPSSAADREFRGDACSLDTPGMAAPRVLHRQAARYTPKAMRARIQGAVDVEVVIRPEGTVDRARVAKSLDAKLGLDDEAVRAAKLWTFESAILNGRPVAVFGVIRIFFRIH